MVSLFFFQLQVFFRTTDEEDKLSHDLEFLSHCKQMKNGEAALQWHLSVYKKNVLWMCESVTISIGEKK